MGDGGRVVVDCSGLPATLRDRLRRTAAFANPMFFEREQARLSTHNTQRMKRNALKEVSLDDPKAVLQLLLLVVVKTKWQNISD